jgi:hypothetical protein
MFETKKNKKEVFFRFKVCLSPFLQKFSYDKPVDLSEAGIPVGNGRHPAYTAIISRINSGMQREEQTQGRLQTSTMKGAGEYNPGNCATVSILS